MNKYSILLVDDDKESFNLINKAVNSQYKIDFTSDISDVQSIVLSKDRPNLILLNASTFDVINDIDAYELAQTLSRDARCSDVPIIFIVDEESKNSIDKCYQNGAINTIFKPFYVQELTYKIKTTLNFFKLRNSLSNALEERQRHIFTIERQLNTIDEHIAYIKLDLNHNLCDISSAFAKLLNCTKDEYIKNNKHCLSKELLGVEKYNEIFDGVKEKETYVSEIRAYPNGKEMLFLEIKIAKDFNYYDDNIGYVVTFQDITAKKNVEKKNIELDVLNHKLDENVNYLEQFKKAVEKASIFSITDENGIIKEVNKNFEDISGYKKEELLGKPHSIVRHEDMPKEVFQDMWKTIQSGSIWKGLVKNRSKNGKAYHVISEIVPIMNVDGSFREYISIRNDVTELEEYKQTLKNELSTKNKSLDENVNYKVQYEDAINQSMAIIKTDENNIIEYANEKFCQISGYTLDELVGINCSDLKEDIYENEQDCETITKELKEKKIVSKIMTNKKNNGEKYYLDTLFYSVFDTSGNLVENLQIMHDITEIVSLNEEIVNTQKEVLLTMGAIGEARSKETGEHVIRVAEYSYFIARKYGLSEEESELLKQASPMHDIGKIAIPDYILNKPSKLTSEEFEIMKTHAQRGYEMLKYSNKPLLKASAEIAYSHHEKYDGTGYPQGLYGDNIPIFGRITAIADIFDALGTSRAYKEAWDLDNILELFEEEKGKHFDPKLVDILFEHLDEFLEIRNKFN
jgi:PAS domain S-box-containing protein